MKRNEIIRLIADSVAEFISMQNDSSIQKQYPDYEEGNYILSKLEQAGMKPPRYTKVSESNEIEAVEGWEDG
jgi:hypothetical protein